MSLDLLSNGRTVSRVRLGRADLSLTRLGLGGAPLGNLYREVDEDEAVQAVNMAWNLGIRYFDTAPLYGSGLSEKRMGRVLRAHPRQEYVVSSKVGWLIEPDDTIRNDGLYVGLKGGGRRLCDYSRDGTFRSIEDSLNRLGLDRIDIVYIHDLDIACHGADLPRRFAEAMEGAYPALAELRRQGVIGAIGLGVNEWQVCEQAMAHGDFDCFLLAGRYSLLDQSSLSSFLPQCARRNVSVIIGGAFNSGILATGAVPGAYYDYKPAPPPILEHTRRLEAICRHHGVQLAAAALQFPSFHPAVASVIPGGRNGNEIAANVALFEMKLPAALWAELKAEGLLPEAAPVPV